MPWGWECRAKLIKQVPHKPTQRQRPISLEINLPGPEHYEPPQIFCGKGFSKIKRAPAYTFGHLPKSTYGKPAAKPNAPMFNLRGITNKGCRRIPGSLVTPHIEPPYDKLKVPGPANYAPGLSVRYKRPPAYSIRPAPRPTYVPWDQWTPSPNMYLPPIPKAKPPAYTLGYPPRTLTTAPMPGPGEHEPNFNYVKKTKPAFSFGHPFRTLAPPKMPAPNTYCEKKFLVSKRTIPAPSFGIRHTPYLGEQAVYLKSSKLELQIKKYNEG